ncbi:hypothetical protein [Natrononativus amylolyticus]|uniref:hypothetical protein n=1 Tax=Natrononativus amylolyticus TaxID=2963434 RepID=UPI0020CF8695|nr:hypothetical protein [Natrononativus amylolyticus]
MTETVLGYPDRDPDPLTTLVEVLTAATRYDFALAVIPLAFVVAVVAATALNLTVIQALVPAAVIGIIVIVDACYLNPPVEPDSE